MYDGIPRDLMPLLAELLILISNILEIITNSFGVNYNLNKELTLETHTDYSYKCRDRLKTSNNPLPMHKRETR